MPTFTNHHLTYEMTQLHALQDLACEWCHDYDSEESERDGQRVSLETVSSDKPTQCGPALAPAVQGALL